MRIAPEQHRPTLSRCDAGGIDRSLVRVCQEIIEVALKPVGFREIVSPDVAKIPIVEMFNKTIPLLQSGTSMRY